LICKSIRCWSSFKMHWAYLNLKFYFSAITSSSYLRHSDRSNLSLKSSMISSNLEWSSLINEYFLWVFTYLSNKFSMYCNILSSFVLSVVWRTSFYLDLI
jgi:hypothetical protein